MDLEIKPIDEASEYLQNVKSLWRTMSASLGFFPEGAFFDHALRKTILIATANNIFCGYLLYRVSRRRITIVHLAVEPEYHGQGVARTLVNYLSSVTQQYLGIGLNCRRDFEVSKMWPRLGFTARHEHQSKKSSTGRLTYWWLDHNHPDLWSISANYNSETKIRAVIDANVFYDIHDISDPQSEESKSLTADWLQDSIDLCITGELRNEINRNANADQRLRHQSYANLYIEVRSDQFNDLDITHKIRSLFPEDPKTSDESDLNQIAKTISAKIPYFITRDERLLGISDAITSKFDLFIIRPSDFIIHLDQLRRTTDYQAASLAATQIRDRLLQVGEQQNVISRFRVTEKGEKHTEFQSLIRRYLVSPQIFECRCKSDEDGTLLALTVFNRNNPNILEVPIFRACRNRLSRTLIRYLIQEMLRSSANEKRSITRVTDSYITSEMEEALKAERFEFDTSGWTKINLKHTGTSQEIANRLVILGQSETNSANYCNKIGKILLLDHFTQDHQLVAQTERLLWPAKITNSEIPTYIIPIQARWAQHLFDTNLARQTLFGAELKLALSRESVYYRSSHPGLLTSPARILWYVSMDSKYEGTGEIRACSQMFDVVVDKPKNLFRRFRHLGIYEWRHVFAIASEPVG